MGRFNNNSGDGERGPGWYDVHSELRRIRDRYGSIVRLDIGVSNSFDHRWGLYACVRVCASGQILGASGYGSSYPNGARTLASACYVALVKAWDQPILYVASPSTDGGALEYASGVTDD